MSLPALLEQRLRLPVVAAPMFLISNPELVLACCRNGVVGSFPALNQRESSGFKAWLEEIEAGLATLDNPAPYAVNLADRAQQQPAPAGGSEYLRRAQGADCHHQPRCGEGTGRCRAQLWRPGVPRRDHAPACRESRRSRSRRLIAVAAGAGGHAGTWSPFALIAEIREFFDKTLLLAGCLNHGHEILAAQLLGADLAYFGTRFIGTTESHAPDAYKDMLLTAKAADIIHTPAVSGVPASFMRQLEAAGFDMAALQGKGEVNFGDKLKPINDEAKAWKTVWSAGQGVGQIGDLPSVDQLIARLDAEYRQALERAAQLPKRWPR